jgi:hypothetical protein
MIEAEFSRYLKQVTENLLRTCPRLAPVDELKDFVTMHDAPPPEAGSLIKLRPIRDRVWGDRAISYERQMRILTQF